MLGIPYEGATAVPIAGATVEILAINRTTVLATGVADAAGLYNLSVPRLGSFYVASQPQGAWGGGWPSGPSALSPTTFLVSGTVTVALYAYPRIAYNNATLLLPGWNNLSTILDNGNGNSATSFVQQPVLSWVQDGVYYINASDDLVFFSIPNDTVTLIHAWVPLYTNMMNYAGWQNEFFLTQDGQFAYGAGCLAKCAAGATITFFAVNLTTFQAFEHNFTGFSASQTTTNAQVNMLGLDGNASTAAFITADGTLHLWNLWNGTQYVGTKLTYFEANNAYWVPYLNSFVNFQAEGARGDHLEQWTLTPNGTFVPVFRGQWYTGGFVANGVNGLFLNLTAHLLWAGVDYQGGIQTFAYNWSANGTLDAERYFYESPANVSKYPNPRIVPQVSSDEHRFTVVGSGPAFQTAWWPYGGNESFAVDPTPGHIVFYSSNVSVDHLDNSTYYPTQAYAHSYSLDGQYFDTSRLISYYSYDCLDNFVHVTTCPVAGTSPGTVAGTVYYVWKTGLPEAGNPSTNGQAQVGPPPEPVVATTQGVDWVNVSWTDSETPVLNFTLSWGSSSGSWPFSTSLTSSNRSFNVTGLHPATFYEFRVVALNLHSADAGTIVNLTLKSDPDVPTDLRTVGVNATNATVAWTNPPDSLLNTTVYVGPSCGTWTQRNSAGVVASYRIRGLTPQTRYCVEVGAWNVTGESPRSDALTILTAGVPMAATNLVATPLNDATIALSWSNPPGSLVNVTVFYGLECGAWTHGPSVGVVAEYLATGLLPDTTYCFSVQAWNASGEGPLSAPIRATPLRAPPDAPTELDVAAVSAYGENLTWVLPTGLRDTDLLNTSLYEGASCGNWSSVTDLGQVADAWEVTGLSSEVQYDWAVALWNTAGESALSACASAATAGPSVPVPRPTFSNVNLTIVSPTSASLSWEFGTSSGGGASTVNVSYFLALVETTCGTPGRAILAHASPAGITNLTPLTSYCFAVTAVEPNGTTVTSGTVSATTPAVPAVSLPHPPPPTRISPFLVGSLTVGVAVALVALGMAWLVVLRRRSAGSGPRRRDKP
ncbi:MAG: fibronectin type III domain-containing protein [Thermoplasmata archaeon]|nr:fibronectin type III domain-containing protein [Thermoplasmata archaeon]